MAVRTGIGRLLPLLVPVAVVGVIGASAFAMQLKKKQPAVVKGPTGTPALTPTRSAEVVAAKVDPLHPWEVRMNDGSLKRLAIADKAIALETKFGTVDIPLAEVKKIEFGLRLTEADKKAFDAAVADVSSGDLKKREAGKDALLALGPKAAPFVERAAKGTAGDARRALETVHDKLKAAYTEKDGVVRDHDVVYTADGSKLGGTIRGGVLQARTDKDDELALKTTAARLLVFGTSAEYEEKVEIVELPNGAVYGLAQTHMGKVVGVKVTGAVGGGTVWGSGPYTTDSNLAAAVVHAGALAAGETGIVKIRVVGDAGGYTGTTANGVTSSNWGPYSGGCFEVLGKPKKN